MLAERKERRKNAEHEDGYPGSRAAGEVLRREWRIKDFGG